MAARRIFETAGFFTIAAALHVSAAAILLPDHAEQGPAAQAPPAALAAGGEEVQAMVLDWETPPKIQTAALRADPQPLPADAPLPMPANAPPVTVATAPPPLLSQPEPTPAAPDLPARTEPPILDPAPQIAPRSALTLGASARPDRRPKPRAEPEPTPRREPDPQRQVRQQVPTPGQSTAPQRAGQGGQAQGNSAGGGGGGVSAAARESAMSQWGGQIRSCISRRAAAPRGVRQGGLVVLSVTVGRNGAIQAIGLAGSSGQPALDQAAVTAAQRAGRCPAAPGALTDANYLFQLPIQLQVR